MDSASPPLAGALGVGRHPENFLGPEVGPRFEESMADAFSAAMHLAIDNNEQSEKGLTYRGWWCLQSDLKSVEGRSASAATALGWYHVLKNTRPDKGVIVLAQISSHKAKAAKGVLEGVGYILPKVNAIVENAGNDPFAPIDTIVIASDKNKKDVTDALDELKKIHKFPHPVRVGLPSELDKTEKGQQVTPIAAKD